MASNRKLGSTGIEGITRRRGRGGHSYLARSLIKKISHCRLGLGRQGERSAARLLDLWDADARIVNRRRFRLIGN